MGEIRTIKEAIGILDDHIEGFEALSVEDAEDLVTFLEELSSKSAMRAELVEQNIDYTSILRTRYTKAEKLIQQLKYKLDHE